MSTIECIGGNLVVLFDKRVKYVKQVKNHCPRLWLVRPLRVLAGLEFDSRPGLPKTLWIGTAETCSSEPCHSLYALRCTAVRMVSAVAHVNYLALQYLTVVQCPKTLIKSSSKHILRRSKSTAYFMQHASGDMQLPERFSNDSYIFLALETW